MDTESRSMDVGMVCMFLVSLPFAAVGVFASGFLVWTWLEHREAQGWIEIPATIVQAELDKHRDKDTTTYEVTAEYAYVHQDRDYRGDRVSLYSGSEREAYRELAAHQRSSKPFRCFVNPDDPKEAILYRTLPSIQLEKIPFYSAFAVIFGTAGFFGLVSVLFAAREDRVERDLAAAHPDEPWRWRAGWDAGRIPDSGRQTLRGLWTATIAWNAVSLPLAALLAPVAPIVLREQNFWALIGLLLSAIGLILLTFALYHTLRWRRFGESLFEMASVPGVIGGPVTGVVRIQANLRPTDGFRVRLIHLHRYSTQHGNKTKTHTRRVWEDERVILRELASDDYSRTVVPVLFAVPYSESPTTVTDSDSRHLWQLVVTARVPGVNYKAEFEVPVFKTDQSSPDFQLDDLPIADYAAPVDRGRQLAAARIRREPAPAGNATRFVFGMARHPGLALGKTLFATVWGGVITMLLHVATQLFFPSVFPIVFGLFGLVFLWIVLGFWFARSTVDVSHDGIGVRRGLFGLGPRRWIGEDRISGITWRRMTFGQAYWIVVRTEAGRSIRLGSIRGKRLAEALVEVLDEARR